MLTGIHVHVQGGVVKPAIATHNTLYSSPVKTTRGWREDVQRRSKTMEQKESEQRDCRVWDWKTQVDEEEEGGMP